MPGNDVGDRVHNFFAQDNFSQEHHHSPAVDENWPAHTNNLWVGSQGQIGVQTSNTKNYNLQNSDSGKGTNSYPFTSQHGLNFMQSNPRPEFAKSPSQNQQENLNGYMYGNQFYQTRPDEAKLLATDTGYDQRRLASGGFSRYASVQGMGPEQHARVPVRSEPSDSSVSFDLFGGQQQSNMLQSLQRQHSGHSDVEQVQQQVMSKMQELQRQHQLQQLDARQQNAINQVSTVSKVASGSHPPASFHDSTNSGAINYPWVGNTNWFQRGSPSIQGYSNGRNPTNIGQTQQLMGLVPQSTDQSLYGVPVSGSRGSVNPFSQVDKRTTQPMPTFVPVNQYAALQDQDQVSGQDAIFIPRQRSQGDDLFGHAPSQALTNMINMDNPQQANTAMAKSSPFQDFSGRQGLAVPSENSRQKTGVHASSPQNEVGLDPTEERILFGSEDNIWAAFGKSLDSDGEGGNPFDSAGPMNGFSSIQSGPWSALMHSAVAETSSSDHGVKEEWNGLNFQSAEIPSGTQNLMYNSGRHKTSAEENLPPSSSFNSGQPSDTPNMNNSYSDVKGQRLPYEPGQSLHANSSQRLVQSSEEGNNPRQKSVAEVNKMMFGSTSHHIDRETSMRKNSGPLTPEVGGARLQCHKSAGWSDIGSAVPSGESALKVSNINSSHHSQDDNRKKSIEAEAVHGGVTWNSNSGHNSAVDMEHLGSSVVNHKMNSEFSIPNSSTVRGREEIGELQNNYHSDYWKNTDPLVTSRMGERLPGLPRNITKDKDVQGLHSSRGISDIEVKMHETQNSDKKKPNDGYHSNLFSHPSAARMRGNIMSDANDSRCPPIGKKKLTDQVGQNNSWPRKFQYHPMGNMGESVDPPYDRKHPSHSQSMLPQNAHHGHTEVYGQVSMGQAELEEGQSSAVVRDGKGFGKVHPQSSFHSGGSTFNRSDLYSPNKAAQTSPNMLQLLQKVDQSSTGGSMTQFSNSEQRVSSEMPEAENSDGSVGHLQQSQSSTAQGFGLQLGPPSQRVSVQNHSLSSQTIQDVSSSHSLAADEIGEKSRGRMHPLHQGQSLPPIEHSGEELKYNRSRVPGSTCDETSVYTAHGNFSTVFDSSSGSPFLRSQLQNPPVGGATVQLSTNQSMSVPFDKYGPCSAEKGDTRSGPGNGQSGEAFMPRWAGNVKQDNPTISAGKSQLSSANGPQERLSANQVSSKEPGSFSMSGIAQHSASSQMRNNMWANIPPRQPLFGAPSNKESSHTQQSLQFNMMESSLSAAERQGDQDANKGSKFTQELGTNIENIWGSVEGEEQRVKEIPSQQVPFQNIEPVQMSDSQDREPMAKNFTGGSPANSASMQRDIEAFGRSLKPTNFPHQNYSLLNQMQGMKHVETDPSDRAVKRLRVSDSSTGILPIPSADSRGLSFYGQENLQRGLSSQQGGKMTPQDVLASCQDDAQSSSLNNNSNPFNSEHAQISPQMAPSWFNQYGSFKNAQMLQMYETQIASSMRTIDQPFTNSSSGLKALDSIQKVIPPNADISPIDNLGPSSVTSSAANEDFSSPQTLPLNVVGQQHQLLKPNKRTRVIAELTPWYKEVSMDSRSIWTIRFAETDWAKSTNTLLEKVEENTDLTEYGPLRFKVTRRVVLTTQLMQQLFRPPSSTILSSDANLGYESVAYSISRLALGDACSMVSCSNGDSEPLNGKRKTSERNDKQTFAKAVEELTIRAARLENDFLRLDKRASILDVTVEGQDIDKFSVIYRFAKFHGRVQADGVETPSSSDARNKPCVQRYVTALPMPKNLPSMVQCLSL